MHSLLRSTHKYSHFKNKNKISDGFKHFTLWIVYLSTLHPPSFASEYAKSPGYFCFLHCYTYHSAPLDVNQFLPLPCPMFACCGLHMTISHGYFDLTVFLDAREIVN